MTKTIFDLFNECSLINDFPDFGKYPHPRDIKLEYPYNQYADENGTEVLEFALAGFTKEQISVQVENDRLSITVTPQTVEKKQINYVHHGIAKRYFHVDWLLTGTHDKNKIKTKYENGLLTVMIPQKEKCKKTLVIE